MTDQLYTCDHCGQLCEVRREVRYFKDEAYGIPKMCETVDLTSKCCNSEVSEIDEYDAIARGLIEPAATSAATGSCL